MPWGAQRRAIAAVAAASATAAATALLLREHPNVKISGNGQLQPPEPDASAGESTATQQAVQQQQRQDTPGTTADKRFSNILAPKSQKGSPGASDFFSARHGGLSGSLDLVSDVDAEQERERHALSGALNHRCAGPGSRCLDPEIRLMFFTLQREEEKAAARRAGGLARLSEA